MIQGIIGKKIGMTQIFTDDGRVIPVTMIQAGPCLVVQKKNIAKQRAKAQLGFVEPKPVKHVTKPQKGHFEKAKVPPTRRLHEFLMAEDEPGVGDTISVDIFSENEIVNVRGTTKGKGFQGVVRRYGYAGGRATHGSMFHRQMGSSGSTTYPGEVIKGKGMPGRMGGKQKTVMGLQVVKVDKERNLLLVRGAVPGFNGNYIYVLKNSFKRR
ncbi:MAG: 50S ribosomal protein L3 [Candidatus Aminicenantes bacterium]|jgi:large subunit ribosomal protein L3|nr:50S ribosomal protein L3 [Candidatus Aminicenantes bacterium]